MQRILVTGGAGFIGRHLIRKLLQKTDNKIISIDNFTNGNSKALLALTANFSQDRFAIYKEDIRNRETIADIVKKERIDACIHLAAKISVAESIKNPYDTIDVNVNGTLSILDACSENDVKNFVFASSAAVYGEPKILPLREDHPLDPLSPYGASKAADEALITSYKNSQKIKNAVLLRFFNVYGEGQSLEYAGVITRFAERLAKGLPPIIYGTGEQSRDFISVSDVTNAMILASEIDASGIFNIGTGQPISISELARKMTKAFNLNLEPIYANAQRGDIMHSYANIRKSKEVLRFSPADTIDSSLRQSLNWLIDIQK